MSAGDPAYGATVRSACVKINGADTKSRLRVIVFAMHGGGCPTNGMGAAGFRAIRGPVAPVSGTRAGTGHPPARFARAGT